MICTVAYLCTALAVLTENKSRKLYIESYGCAMNFADSEVVASIMSEIGVETTNDEMEADIIFINTCSIRDNAEQKMRACMQRNSELEETFGLSDDVLKTDPKT